jgi:hypothetical protein
LTERRKIEQMNQIRLQYIYTWKCHKETPGVAVFHKQKCHFFPFTKLENRKAEQVLPGDVGTSGRGKEEEKGYRRVNMA